VGAPGLIRTTVREWNGANVLCFYWWAHRGIHHSVRCISCISCISCFPCFRCHGHTVAYGACVCVFRVFSCFRCHGHTVTYGACVCVFRVFSCFRCHGHTVAYGACVCVFRVFSCFRCTVTIVSERKYNGRKGFPSALVDASDFNRNSSRALATGFPYKCN